jgi:hypothetical protein
MSDTPRTDLAVNEVMGVATMLNACEWQQKFGQLANKMRELERELAEATRSPYIDNDERPAEIIEAIYEALDGITADAENSANSGSIVSRVKAAVRMAGELAEASQHVANLEVSLTAAINSANARQNETEHALAQRDALAVALRRIASGDYSFLKCVCLIATKALAAVEGDKP